MRDWTFFEDYQADCLTICTDFGYPESVRKAVLSATDGDQLSRIMGEARRRYL